MHAKLVLFGWAINSNLLIEESPQLPKREKSPVLRLLVSFDEKTSSHRTNLLIQRIWRVCVIMHHWEFQIASTKLPWPGLDFWKNLTSSSKKIVQNITKEVQMINSDVCNVLCTKDKRMELRMMLFPLHLGKHAGEFKTSCFKDPKNRIHASSSLFFPLASLSLWVVGCVAQRPSIRPHEKMRFSWKMQPTIRIMMTLLLRGLFNFSSSLWWKSMLCRSCDGFENAPLALVIE